ncbi:hypothetical protein [Pyramidobacter piscolens]|uniref:hypothetical protein n=1 Tax=Pyramidobacter piscolens TaxID=638849 RepID=UPI0026669E61|nr:hypothetical protein [Pyramidobacter piscolens]
MAPLFSFRTEIQFEAKEIQRFLGSRQLLGHDFAAHAGNAMRPRSSAMALKLPQLRGLFNKNIEG